MKTQIIHLASRVATTVPHYSTWLHIAIGSHFSLRKWWQRPHFPTKQNWQRWPHFPTKLAAAASFSYKIEGGARICRFGNITGAWRLFWHGLGLWDSGYWPLFQNEIFKSKFWFLPQLFQEIWPIMLAIQGYPAPAAWHQAAEPRYFKMTFCDQNSASAISGILAKYAFRGLGNRGKNVDCPLSN